MLHGTNLLPVGTQSSNHVAGHVYVLGETNMLDC